MTTNIPSRDDVVKASQRYSRYLREARAYEDGLIDVPMRNPCWWDAGGYGITLYRVGVDGTPTEIFVSSGMLDRRA